MSAGPLESTDQHLWLVENSPDMLSQHTLEGIVLYASPACCSLLGYQPEELVNCSLSHLSHPRDRDALANFWTAVTRSAKVASCCYRIQHKNGQYIWLETTGRLVQRQFCREPTSIIVAASRDITERRTAETHLIEEVEQGRLLSAIAQRIRQSLKLEDILNTTVAEVQQYLQTDRVLIYRFGPDGSGVVVVESTNAETAALQGRSLRDSCFDLKQANTYHQGRIKVVPDINNAGLSSCHVEFLTQFQVRAYLVVPILAGNHLWGLLIAHHCSGPRQWQPSNIVLLDQLATRVGIAIQQSELYQQVQRLNRDLKHKVQEQTTQLQQVLEFEATLKQITDKVRDSLDESQILQAAVKALARVLGVNSCNAAMYDLQHHTSTICYEHATTIPRSQGRVSKMTDFPELYQQLLSGQSFQFCSLLLHPGRGRVTMLACPISDDQGVLGDLWLVKQHDYAFGEQEIQLAQHVANQCAIAIRQARLYQAAQQQVRELEKLNQLKDDFLSTISHELRTPITNMKMSIHMLKTAPSPERREQYLKILQDDCHREAELIDDLLDLQCLEAGAYQITHDQLVLREWLPSIIGPFEARAHNRHQILNVELSPDLVPVTTDRTNLGRILAELLHNACKYTPAHRQIDLQIYQIQPKVAAMPLVTVFTVRNQAEVQATELARIFEKFYRIPNTDPWKQGGTGLGLALVKKLVEQLNGTITAESQAGWTTLQVELPEQHQ